MLGNFAWGRSLTVKEIDSKQQKAYAKMGGLQILKRIQLHCRNLYIENRNDKIAKCLYIYSQINQTKFNG